MKTLIQFIYSFRSAIPLYLFLLKMTKLGSSLYNQKSSHVVFTPFWLQSTINSKFPQFVRLRGPAQGK